MKNIEVVAAIIVEGDKIFATQRGYGKYRGYWEFPGGKIEAGESREEALRREIMEELSISIEIEKFFCTVEYDYPEFHLTMHCHLCKISDGKPRLNEHHSAKWLTPSELRSVEWLPADLDVIDMLER